MADPYKTMFEKPESDENEILLQELVTYERRPDGKVYRIVTTRKFYKDDYVDTQTTSIL